jgi:HK97 family phage major capsid protein
MSKLVEAREKLGAKHQLLETVLKEAGSDYDFTKVKALGDLADTQAKVEKVREINNELTQLTAECKRLELDEIAEATRKVREQMAAPAAVTHPSSSEGHGTKSVGQRFVESAEFKRFREEGDETSAAVAFEDIELKTLMSTAAGWAPETTRTGRVIDKITRPIQILDLIPIGPTAQVSVVYMEETTRTHNAAEKAEGAAYAEDAFALTERSSPVRKITTSLPVTDEQLEDEGQVRTYVDGRLTFSTRQRLDNQVLNGDGSAPNLRGILQTSSVQSQAKSTDPTFDAVHKAITKVRVVGRAVPNAIVMHSNDWQEIRLTRTNDGIYIMGNPSEAGPMALFGLPVALNEAIAEHTALVGDFANYCGLWEKRGIEIRVGYVASQFAEGQQTLRADVRVAFVVYRPEAFCTVTGI